MFDDIFSFANLSVAVELKYISQDELKELKPTIYRLARMLKGLRRSFEGKDEPFNPLTQ